MPIFKQTNQFDPALCYNIPNAQFNGKFGDNISKPFLIFRHMSSAMMTSKVLFAKKNGTETDVGEGRRWQNNVK
jgi:hypothetical protein